MPVEAVAFGLACPVFRGAGCSTALPGWLLRSFRTCRVVGAVLGLVACGDLSNDRLRVIQRFPDDCPLVGADLHLRHAATFGLALARCVFPRHRGRVRVTGDMGRVHATLATLHSRGKEAMLDFWTN